MLCPDCPTVFSLFLFSSLSQTFTAYTLLFSVEQIRLADSHRPREGRLEVYHNGQWGTVCGDDYFDDRDASVACFQLGFG